MASRATLSLCAMLVMASGSARAEDAFPLFKSVCIDTKANGAESLAIADKSGWMPMPQKMLDSFPLKSFQGQPQGRFRSTAEGLYMMVTADSLIPGMSGSHGNMCMMGFYGFETDFATAADAFAAVPKRDGKGSDYFYIWREENGAHVAISDEQAKSWKSPEPLYFLGGGLRPKTSFLAYGVATPQN